MAGQAVLLTIERQVVGELVDDHVRQQSGPSQATLNCRRRDVAARAFRQPLTAWPEKHPLQYEVLFLEAPEYGNDRTPAFLLPMGASGEPERAAFVFKLWGFETVIQASSRPRGSDPRSDQLRPNFRPTEFEAPPANQCATTAHWPTALAAGHNVRCSSSRESSLCDVHNRDRSDNYFQEHEPSIAGAKKMNAIRGVVKNGRVEVDAPPDWPDGTPVRVELGLNGPSKDDDESPETLEEIQAWLHW